MTGAASGRVYEQESVRQEMGETLRPGGLALTERALALCSLPVGARVLDVGCGLGTTGRYLRDGGYSASGVDLSALLLQAGHSRHPALPLVQAAGERLPLADEQFTAILAECSLSVLAETDLVLAEFYRLLRQGGYLIMSDLYARNPVGLPGLRSLPLTSCLSRVMGQGELVARLSRPGFCLACWEDHSEVLRQLNGPLSGLLAGFCQGPPTGRGMDALDMQLAIAKAKPGYFLLIARKYSPPEKFLRGLGDSASHPVGDGGIKNKGKNPLTRRANVA